MKNADAERSARATIPVRFRRRPVAFRLRAPAGEKPPPAPAAAAPSAESLEAAFRARGEAQAKELGLLRSLARSLEQETARLRTLREEFLRDMETRVVELASVVADWVLGERIERGDYRVAEIVRPAIDVLSSHGVPKGEVTVRLHPSDLLALEASGEIPSFGPDVAFRADASVEKASCVVETPVGSVLSDSREAFDAALERLRRARPKGGGSAGGGDGGSP